MEPLYTCLACDLGGTHIRLGVGDVAGEKSHVQKAKVHNFHEGLNAEAISDFLTSTIAEYHDNVASLLPAWAPLVFAFPGPVADRRHILAAPTLMGGAADLPDLSGRLSEVLG